MAIALRTLELPFETGLGQKVDDLWREPGAASGAANLVKLKGNTLQKRQGMTALTATARVIGQLGSTLTLGAPKRLSSMRGQLLLVALDAWADAVFTFDDTYGFNCWIEIDRISEAYLQPYEVVATTGNINAGAPLANSLYECDLGLAAGAEVLVYSDQNASSGSLGVVCSVRSPVDGALLAQPTLVSLNAHTASIPKVAVCGTNIVVAWSDALDSNIYGFVLDATFPVIPSSSTQLNVTTNDSVNHDGSGTPNPYDLVPVLGDTSKCALIYESTVAGTRHITLAILNVPALTLSSSTTVDAADATWTADNGVSAANSSITALALRVDSVAGNAAFAYGWRTSTTTRIAAGIRNYPALTSVASTVNLMGTPGPLAPSTDNPPAILTLEFSAQTTNFVIRASPRNATLCQGAGQQLPWVAHWQMGTSVTIAANFPHVTWNVSLWSRDLVAANGLGYFVAYTPSNTQGSFFLFCDDSYADVSTSVGGTGQDWYPYRLVGNIAPRLTSPLVPAVSTPLQTRSACHLVPNTLVPTTPYGSASATYETLVPLALSPGSTGLALQRIDFGSALSHQMAELGQNVIVANGCPSGIDGQGCYELAFPIYPVIVTVTMAGSGGSLSAGVYNWIAIYTWTDGRGQQHLSARSVPGTATAVLNDKATLVITTCPFSGKTRTVNVNPFGTTGPMASFQPRRYSLIKLYRTQANGSVYTNVIASDGFIQVNGQRVGTITYVDSASDASIAPNALVYGDGSDGTAPGNILDNLSSPAFQAVTAHENRVFGADGPRIWATKAFTTGQGSGFHENMAFSADDSPANVTALVSLDDKLVIFKRDRILYMTGLGPADNGQDSDWTQPQRIASDVGCIDWRSVVTTPQGVYFMSLAGRRLLTRDLQVVPVPLVEDIDNANPVTTSALIHPTGSRLTWTQNTDDKMSPRVGTRIDRDYQLDAWTQSNLNDGAGHSTIGFVSACVANAIVVPGPPARLQSVYHAVRADGVVMREVTTSFQDQLAAAPPTKTFVAGIWTSPWLKADGLVGWSHWAAVRLALRALNPAALTVTLAYNYSASITDTFTFTAAQIAAFTTPIPEIRLQPTRPREPALQIQITDASDTGTTTGQGFLLAGVRVDYGVEPGGQRVPVAQQG